MIWNRQTFVKDPETGKRVSRLNPKEQWIVVECPELQVVDIATWDQAQKLKARYSSHAGNRRQTKKRLLTGILKCGCCGGNMTIARHDRYYCAARREKGTCSANFGINASEAEGRVLDGLRDLLLGKEDLIKEFEVAFTKELKRLDQERSMSKTNLKSELEEVERGIQRCISFITSGDSSLESVRSELARLEARKTELVTSMDVASIPPNIEVHPNLPLLYRRKVEELSVLLEDEDHRAEAMDVIRSLITRIDVYPGKRRGHCYLELVGALAGILTLATNKKTTPEGGTSLLVAGVGFEPTTFRL